MTKRLNVLSGVLPKCRILADVGCDHGYVGANYLKNGIAEKVIFTDVSASSLKKAETLCRKEGLTNAEFVLCNGLEGVNFADAAVIAGMGGLEIIGILERAPFLPQRLLLQPMRNCVDVRQFLCRNYRITSDFTLWDKKFYTVIVAEKSETGDCLTVEEQTFGRTNLLHPEADFWKFLEKEIEKFKKIATPSAQERRMEYENLKRRLENERKLEKIYGTGQANTEN